MKTGTISHPPQGLRPHEVTTELEAPRDAWITFIGAIHTPWKHVADCPRQGRLEGPECSIKLYPPWDEALDGIEAFERLEIYYWLDQSRRDMLKQNPKRDNEIRGTFALRSPMRPNPIGASLVALIRREGPSLIVRGMDCLNDTPLIDIKPERNTIWRRNDEERRS